MISFKNISLDGLSQNQKIFLKDFKTLTDLKLKTMSVDYNRYISSTMCFKKYNLKSFLESFNIL